MRQFHRLRCASVTALVAGVLLGQVGPIWSAPAPVVARTADDIATGEAGVWDFNGTDVTVKEELNELWVVDAYGDPSGPFVNRFNLDSLDTPPVKLLLALPAEAQGGVLLGIAEIPHGDYRGMNLVLLDMAFGEDTPQPLMGIVENSGAPVEGLSFAEPKGLPLGTRISSIDINPEREEIAAYDIQNHAVVILDFSFTVTMSTSKCLGSQSFFTSRWFVDNNARGSGAGVAYLDADRLLVGAGFLNDFELHLVLEYNLAQAGEYSGRALDLSAARDLSRPVEAAITTFDVLRRDDKDLLAALNYGNDGLYIFEAVPSPSEPPVRLGPCGVYEGIHNYRVEWTLEPDSQPTSIRILENAVEVASLPPDATAYDSPLPLSGKTLIEVAAEKDGVLSELRATCWLANTETPDLPDLQYTGTRVGDRENILGLAVTKTPATASDFRAYLLAADSNAVSVYDYKLDPNTVETFALDPPVATVGRNLAARGIALTTFKGRRALAILDPDGALGNGVPAAQIHALDGPDAGTLLLDVPAIDLSKLASRPYLAEWDSDKDGNFVAAGWRSDGEYVLVRVLFDGTKMSGTQMVVLPHRQLTPFDSDEAVGIGVSVLPSGNLLVAGSDTFSRTYTDALLLTPFDDADSARSVKLVGYAQGLIVSSQFYGMGVGIGPGMVQGFDAAYFPPEGERMVGVGVSYLSVPPIDLIQKEGWRLIYPAEFLVQSTNRCAHPDLLAEQLVDKELTATEEAPAETGPLVPVLASKVSSTDFLYALLNRSKTASLKLQVRVELEGVAVQEAAQDIQIPPGRYHRGSLRGRSEKSLNVIVKSLEGSATVRIVAGAMGVSGVPSPTFLRGDCDRTGVVELTDAVFGLNWLFMGGTATSCEDACDADDSGVVNLTDMILVLNYLFKSGPAPQAPGADACGPDPTPDDTLADCMAKQGACP